MQIKKIISIIKFNYKNYLKMLNQVLFQKLKIWKKHLISSKKLKIIFVTKIKN